MRKCFILFLMSTILCGCDYDKIKYEYKNGNPHAKELLLHGVNSKICEKLDSDLIKKALNGDEEAKCIIYAQMEILKGMPENNIHAYPMYIHRQTIYR